MTYNDFRDIWRSALEYTPNQRESYLAACQEACTDACDADTFDAIYTMAHGGMKAIRARTGLSQVKFATKFGFHRRNVERWEVCDRTEPQYIDIMLAYIVMGFSDK